MQVGTIPALVRNFAKALKRGVPSGEFIETGVRKAEVDVVAFVHRPILKALRKSPDGVRLTTFARMTDNGVNLAMPKAVAAAMRLAPAVVYHEPSGEYRLATVAHRTALLRQPIWAYWL